MEKTNYFTPYNFEKMMTMWPCTHERSFNLEKYYKILCPELQSSNNQERPDFLQKYLELPSLKRLKGVGLLCGSDWTALFHNRFFYSRFDHSVGVALITWHFTHDKAQSISGLFHDISTPTFSHVSDFRKGDALTQTSTEAQTSYILKNDSKLAELLTHDCLTVEQIEDYHKYPIADNEIPSLSADRLEYMFPSGMALEGSWTLDEVERCYNDICILTNEYGVEELSFRTLETAENYCRKFCMTGHILQLNEDKLTLHLLGEIMNRAVELNILSENDFMVLSEKEIIQKIEDNKKRSISDETEMQARIHFFRLYRTFRKMTKIEHTNFPLPEKEYFCVNLKVKQRYINPLVKCSDGNRGRRLYDISSSARKIIDDFKTFTDTPYGCVKLL